MTHPVITQRLAERERAIGTARAWAAQLTGSHIVAVVVVGSFARGDFNKWSDIDVLVVADRLPGALLARLAMLGASAPPGLQPIGWTVAELARRWRERDPLALEAYEAGVVVRGALPSLGRKPGASTTARPGARLRRGT